MIIYGKNAVYEAIYNEHKINKLYLDIKFNDYKLLNLINEKEIKYMLVSKDKLNEMTKNALHQGVVADVSDYKVYSLEEILDLKINRYKLIVLDSVQDPHNLGAILRTAEATDMTAVIYSKKNSVGLTSTVAKVSAGAIEKVKVVEVNNLNNCIQKLKDNNILVYGTDMTASISYRELPKDKSVAIVLGNEGYGIRTLVKRNCSDLIKIPMKGKINSLNVSVAGALIMYEIM